MVAVHAPFASFESQFVRICGFADGLVIVHHDALNGAVTVYVIVSYLPIASDRGVDIRGDVSLFVVTGSQHNDGEQAYRKQCETSSFHDF